MSVRAWKWAMQQPAGSPHEMLVLVTLAYHHNEKRGGQCDPALATLAAETKLSKNGVRSALAGLEASGFIRIVSRTVRGRDISKQYDLLIEECGSGCNRGAPGEPLRNNPRGAPGEPLNTKTGVRPVKGAPGEPMGAPGEPNRERIERSPSQEEEWVRGESDWRGLRVVGGRDEPTPFDAGWRA